MAAKLLRSNGAERNHEKPAPSEARDTPERRIAKVVIGTPTSRLPEPLLNLRKRKL